MKKQDQDELADCMRGMKPLAASEDFTELLMEQIDPEFLLEKDALTVGLRDQSKSLQLSPGIQFSDGLMGQLDEPRASEQINRAIRPRRIWAGVGGVLVLFLAMSFVSNEPAAGASIQLLDIAELLSWATDFTLLVSCFVCGFLLLGIDYFLRKKVALSAEELTNNSK